MTEPSEASATTSARRSPADRDDPQVTTVIQRMLPTDPWSCGPGVSASENSKVKCDPCVSSSGRATAGPSVHSRRDLRIVVERRQGDHARRGSVSAPVAARPSMPGVRMSTWATSGAVSAARPSATWVHTVMSGVE